jgi:hypothetical protein
MSKPDRKLLSLLLLFCLIICLQATAFAQDETWTGAAGDGLWSDGGNWTPAINGGTGYPNGSTYNVTIGTIGPPQPMLDVSATVGTLTINPNQSLLINSFTLTVTGSSIMDDGILNVSVNNGGRFGDLEITGYTTLSGTGTVQLGSSAALIDGSGTLTNQLTSQFGIYGQGVIEVSNLVNQGQILGSPISSTFPLTIESPTVTNSKTIGTQGFGTVRFRDTTVQNAGGTITGGEGSATLYRSTIIGGTLGTQVYQGINSPSTLNGVTITGDYYITASANYGAQTFLEGTITNNGTIQVTSPSGAAKAELTINYNVTLAGTGSVLLSGLNAFLDGSGTLTNQQTISGNGSYGNITVRTLGNQATVASFSTDPSAPLTIQSVITNTGGTFSSASGYVNIVGDKFTDGNIVSGSGYAATLSGEVKLSGVNFSGNGTVNAVDATLDGTVATNTNGTIILVGDSNILTLEGPLSNSGTIQANAAVAEAYIMIGGNVTITSPGTITTSNNPNNFVTGVSQNKFAGSKGHKLAPAGSDSLTLNGPSFSGCGTFSGLSLNIEKASSMTNPGGYPLIIDATPFTNSGLLSETSPSGSIQVTDTFSNYNSTTNTLTGGSYNLNGTFQFPNANLVTNAANITLSGFGQIVNQSGVNGLVNFNNNSSKGVFTLSGGQDFSTSGTFTNAGSLIVSKSSTFSIGGSGTNYEQTAGTTTVDGTLTLPAAGQANVTGGTIQSAGSFSGSVSVGNASGTAATFIIGDSVKTSAAVNIANDYTQLATGIMDVQIGGTTAGTQYSQLTVTGPVKLAGTLNIKLINKFKPEVGQTFTVLTSPSVTGTFANVNGTAIGANEHFAIAYNSDSVVLTVESGP